jgi:hypothetical protein
MPLTVLDPTFPMSWDCYASLQVDILRSNGMLCRGTVMNIGLHYEKYFNVLE